MLTSRRTIAMLPVTSLERAREFYERRIGLTPQETLPDGKVLYNSGGTLLALFPRESPTKAEHTVISFEVDDVEGAVRSLSDKGVVFEEYDSPTFKTVNKVCVLGSEKAAWFKDTEGNVLCIHQTI